MYTLPKVFKGLIYCDKCGSYTQRTKLGNLASPCSPPTSYGKTNIRRIHSGKLPYNLAEWPADRNPKTFEELIGSDSPETIGSVLTNLATGYNALLGGSGDPNPPVGSASGASSSTAPVSGPPVPLVEHRVSNSLDDPDFSMSEDGSD